MAIKTEKTGLVSRSVLDNGLVVLSEDLPTYQSASIGIWVNVGSKHESEADAGVSHFIEHMLFKGTPTRSAYDIADVMEGVGGYLNGTTDKEQTCYSARVMDKHLDLSIDLIGDMMRNSLFDSTELNREKNVVVDEIKTYEDSPPDVIHDMFLRSIWGNHPLGRSTIGTEEVIVAATREQLMRYRDTHYRPENMVVTVAGHVDHDRLLAKTQQWFGDLKRGGEPQHDMPLPPVRPHRSFRHRDTEQVYVCLGGEGLRLADEDKYKLQVLDNVLGGGMSSRLFQEIREQRGLVYNIGSFIYSFIEGGVFGIYVVSGPDSIPEVMTLLRKICEDLRRNGVTQREYERSKEYLKGSFSLGLESSSYRMMRLIRSEECYGRFITPEEIMAQIEAVTIDEVNEFARRFLDLDRYCVTALGPFRGARKKLLKTIASGAWEEDIGPYDKPRVRRKSSVEQLVREGIATGEMPPPPSHVHVG
jgi:predicted Zn-dependent peptidase